ncbi:MAG: tRNA (adenosine(37)-N6)-dimethylallyltransferase MiaA [Bacteroidales bacterium]|nr:tRNA (adenosine(37)-N6)-dimethylallyltransferase MiaA [Bacteroidales bacterium]
MTKTLIVLLGPTGVGKTELSLSIARKFNSPIISSDSRQLFKDIPIGTAAPTQEQMKRVKHFFVGILDLHHYFSAAKFEEEVIKFLQEYFKNNDVAVMTGGSMMYIDAVCNGIDDMPTVTEEIREQVMDMYKNFGLDYLVEKLKNLDPEYFEKVDRKNPKRVMHALEMCIMTDKTYTSFRTNNKKARPFNIIKIGLTRDREELYERINKRVDVMIEDGLIDEVKSVIPYRSHNALNTVGYKEIFKYIDGEWTLDFAVEKIKQNTRIYSRKQMTWFKRDESIKWFSPDDVSGIEDYICDRIDD